jgi:hypothetical protein
MQRTEARGKGERSKESEEFSNERMEEKAKTHEFPIPILIMLQAAFPDA